MSAEEELQTFVSRHVKSIWAMELLLLLQRDPARWWSQAELVYEMRASQAIVTDILVSFHRSGLVISADQRWRFAPAEPSDRHQVQVLAKAFQERPSATMRMIVTPDPVQSLSDAFRLKGDDS